MALACFANVCLVVLKQWGELGLLLKCCFTSTETVDLLGTGAQDSHLDFHTAPEVCEVGTHGQCSCFVSVSKTRFLLFLLLDGVGLTY